MATWYLDGTIVTPYNINPDGNLAAGTKDEYSSVQLLGGGSRVNISPGKKSWTFELRDVALADAQAIEASVAKASFSFVDGYDTNTYTVHTTSFSGWQYYDYTTQRYTASMTLEVV